MKSLKRLDIDPLAVYGTLCVKCPVADTALAAPECVARLVEEIAIVQPKLVVVMGPEALDVLNELAAPPGARGARDAGGDPGAHAVDRTRSTRRASTSRSTRSTPSASSGRRSACSATGTRTSRRTKCSCRHPAGASMGSAAIRPGAAPRVLRGASRARAWPSRSTRRGRWSSSSSACGPRGEPDEPAGQVPRRRGAERGGERGQPLARSAPGRRRRRCRCPARRPRSPPRWRPPRRRCGRTTTRRRRRRRPGTCACGSARACSPSSSIDVPGP